MTIITRKGRMIGGRARGTVSRERDSLYQTSFKAIQLVLEALKPHRVGKGRLGVRRTLGNML